MEDEKVVAWVTKYALTDGIFKVDGYVVRVLNTELLRYRKNTVLNTVFRNDWCRTKEGAIAKAEQMRLEKIESHKKCIAKLEAMKFS